MKETKRPGTLFEHRFPLLVPSVSSHFGPRGGFSRRRGQAPRRGGALKATNIKKNSIMHDCEPDAEEDDAPLGRRLLAALRHDIGRMCMRPRRARRINQEDECDNLPSAIEDADGIATSLNSSGATHRTRCIAALACGVPLSLGLLWQLSPPLGTIDPP